MSNAAYGLLGAPLAMAALPLFVQLPAYYATHVGVALAPLGGVLFAARLLDMLQDPLLGHLLDRAQAHQRRWMALGAAVLALAFAALWLPPRPAHRVRGWR
jgi:Na+/melibiose symporter-like transporter